MPTPAAAVSLGPNSGSIAHVQGFNIWLASPDGTGAHRLTNDGTQAAAYHDPSQADDGSVFALRGDSMLYGLDRTGKLLAAPVKLTALENGTEGLVASPDATRVAYTTTGTGQIIDPDFGTPTGAFLYGGTDFATVDGAPVPGAAAAQLLFPSWINESTIVAGDGFDIFVDRVGPSEPESWISWSDGCLTDFDCPSGQQPYATISRPVVSHDNRRLAYTFQPAYGISGRRIASLAGLPPDPAVTRCLMPGQQNESDPGSFAPDGSAFAYDNMVFDPDLFETVPGEGIHVVRLDLGASDCGMSTDTLVLPGGAQPDWGSAAP